jgi:formate dehydrogenase major subunit/formate dehydrogenase alpha subunit
MIDAAGAGDIKAMWVVGSNPVLGLEESDSERVREALRKLDFLVVQDIFLNETAELADVILPASSYADKEGTFTNTERRIQRVRQAIEPVGASKPDLWIIGEIGQRLGLELPAKSPKDVLEEISRVVPLYGGVSVARLDITEFVDDFIPMPAAVSAKQLKVKSLMWPCPDRLHRGTPVLYSEAFATPTGKARISRAMRPAPTPGAGAEVPAGGDMLMATVGFPLFPYRTGTLSRHSYGLNRVEPDPRLHINSRDAERFGIGDQTPVLVTAENMDNSEPVYAVSLIYDRMPEGRAFLAITLRQAGTNPAVREMRRALSNYGGLSAVPIRVEPAPHITASRAELQPAATGNVLDTRTQPL